MGMKTAAGLACIVLLVVGYQLLSAPEPETTTIQDDDGGKSTGAPVTATEPPAVAEASGQLHTEPFASDGQRDSAGEGHRQESAMGSPSPEERLRADLTRRVAQIDPEMEIDFDQIDLQRALAVMNRVDSSWIARDLIFQRRCAQAASQLAEQGKGVTYGTQSSAFLTKEDAVKSFGRLQEHERLVPLKRDGQSLLVLVTVFNSDDYAEALGSRDSERMRLRDDLRESLRRLTL